MFLVCHFRFCDTFKVYLCLYTEFILFQTKKKKEKRKKYFKMVVDFYYVPGSAPCRAVQMAAKAVGVELNLKLTNLMAGEHLKPEYLAVSYNAKVVVVWRHFYSGIINHN